MWRVILKQARVEVGWLGLGCDPVGDSGTWTQVVVAEIEEYGMPFWYGRKRWFLSCHKREGANIGEHVLRSVGLGVGRWRFL